MNCVWVKNEAHNAWMIMDIYLIGVKWAQVTELCFWQYGNHFPCLTSDYLSLQCKNALVLYVFQIFSGQGLILFLNIVLQCLHSYFVWNIVINTFSGFIKMKSSVNKDNFFAWILLLNCIFSPFSRWLHWCKHWHSNFWHAKPNSGGSPS